MSNATCSMLEQGRPLPRVGAILHEYLRSRICRTAFESKPRQLSMHVFLRFHMGLVNQALHVVPQEVVKRSQVGRKCRPSDGAERSRWSDCLACTFTQLESARLLTSCGATRRGGPIAWPARSPNLNPLDYLLPVGPHEGVVRLLGLHTTYFLWGHTKGLNYETPLESEEALLVWIIAATDIGLLGIGDRVYQNMVRRYRVRVDVAGRHIEPFFGSATVCCVSDNDHSVPSALAVNLGGGGYTFFSSSNLYNTPQCLLRHHCRVIVPAPTLTYGRCWFLLGLLDGEFSHGRWICPMWRDEVNGALPIYKGGRNASYSKKHIRQQHHCMRKSPLRIIPDSGVEAENSDALPVRCPYAMMLVKWVGYGVAVKYMVTAVSRENHEPLAKSTAATSCGNRGDTFKTQSRFVLAGGQLTQRTAQTRPLFGMYFGPLGVRPCVRQVACGVNIFSGNLDSSDLNGRRRELHAVFELHTDNQSLRWFLATNKPAGWLAHWLVRLTCFNFTMKRMKGGDNSVADALSRMFDVDEFHAVQPHSVTIVVENLVEDQTQTSEGKELAGESVQTMVESVKEGGEPEDQVWLNQSIVVGASRDSHSPSPILISSSFCGGVCQHIQDEVLVLENS
ncbi:hypothetical protein PR048_016382 [Dryococelus australis]|uniref:Uncharacterized protein n=1 Tax=Dryococelus australis TaxID=614101 RepID=A0ABQ9HJR8_9NEOP|nr:hypothetical protein PR048_016382 [Dryococelus australis]